MSNIKQETVNHNAEVIVDNLLQAILIIGWIITIGGLIVGLVLALSEGEAVYMLISLSALLVLVPTYIVWAFGKLLVNISHNLYNINYALRGVEEEVQVSKVEEKDNTGEVEDVEQPHNGKFRVGQLVVIKCNSDAQFRITSISDSKDGSVRYYSDKFHVYFNEDEIEDFEKYCAEKK